MAAVGKIRFHHRHRLDLIRQRPGAVLKKYSAALSENGAFVISLWRHGHNGVIWQKIEKHFEIIDSAVVTNQKGEIWDVKVLR